MIRIAKAKNIIKTAEKSILAIIDKALCLFEVVSFLNRKGNEKYKSSKLKIHKTNPKLLTVLDMTCENTSH